VNDSIATLVLASACTLLGGCVTFAPPSPLATLGGPATTPRDTSELAMAVGAGAALFDSGHAGGSGFLARYKRGVSEDLDLGVEALYGHYYDKGVLSMEGALRYQMDPHWRLELGVGAADSSDGKSLNGDLGVTVGTRRADRTWNYYGSVRGGWARGYAGDAVFGSHAGGTNADPEEAPPNAAFGLVSLGAQAQLNKSQRFVFEGGAGVVRPRGFEHGILLYLGVGLLFDVPDSAGR
jgi:hypothetical protein